MLELDFPEPTGRCCAADIDARIAENLAWTEALWDEGRAPMSRVDALQALGLYLGSVLVCSACALRLITP